MPVFKLGTKMMLPSLLQLPPTGKGASQSVKTGPPRALTVFNLPSAKKPTDRPSGDQKGCDARSVPTRGSADSDFNGRNQREVLPCVSTRISSRVFPSGEILGQRSGRVSGGATIEETTNGGGKLASRT